MDFPGNDLGLIFSYLEGRQTTEALGAGLSVSFIFSAGFSKTVVHSYSRGCFGNVDAFRSQPFVYASTVVVPMAARQGAFTHAGRSGHANKTTAHEW